MYVILLRFSDNKAAADQYLADHQEWLQRGLDDGVVLLAGPVPSGLGGAVLAHNTSIEDLRKRVDEDPFVVQDVVTAEIIDIDPRVADERLSFLL